MFDNVGYLRNDYKIFLSFVGYELSYVNGNSKNGISLFFKYECI